MLALLHEQTSFPVHLYSPLVSSALSLWIFVYAGVYWLELDIWQENSYEYSIAKIVNKT